jgi:putative salt-induced outer membrane protein YdiY
MDELNGEYAMDLCNSKFMMVFMLLILFGSALSQDKEEEKNLGWFFTAEVAGLLTGGNSESRTLGLSATIQRIWPKSELKFNLGGTNTESSLTSRSAVGTSEDFSIREVKSTEKTAELFFVRGRYDYLISKDFFVLGGVDWLRNKFAGLDSRLLFVIGAGNNWIDNDQIHFKTDYGFTYTFQDDVVENPFLASKFPGVRLAYDFWWKLTASTEFTSVLIVDWNMDNTDDVRIDFTNALPIAISEKLSLKPSLQLLWRNDPALTEVELLAPDGTPTGTKVFTPLQKLDTLFSLTLVLNI